MALTVCIFIRLKEDRFAMPEILPFIILLMLSNEVPYILRNLNDRYFSVMTSITLYFSVTEMVNII